MAAQNRALPFHEDPQTSDALLCAKRLLLKMINLDRKGWI